MANYEFHPNKQPNMIFIHEKDIIVIDLITITKMYSLIHQMDYVL